MTLKGNDMRLFLSILILAGVAFPAFAQNAETTPVTAPEASTLDQRLELAQKMQDLRPVREQVDAAIDKYVQTLPENQRAAMATALKSVLNYKALEKISIDAMAETYTVEELASMVEYYSKPEARTASDKFEQYSAKVFPEIGRMLDQALMRVKTGAPTP
jgi:hypothetical protein